MTFQTYWTKQYEFAGVEWATGLVQLPSGDLFYTGFSKQSTAEQPFQTDLIRIDQAGTIVWSRTLMDGYTMAYGAALSGDGGVYIGGHYNGGTLGDADPGPSGHYDNFIQKYNGNGDLEWTTIVGTDTIDQGMALASSPAGQLYFAGYSYGSLAGANAGSTDVVLSSIDPDGTIKWHRQFGGEGADIAMATTLAGDGSVYVAGYTNGNFGGQQNQGADDGFLTRIDADGNLLWTRFLGSTGVDHIYGVLAASDGSVYVTGREEVTADSANVFLGKFTATGDHVWTQSLGSMGYEYGRSIAETSDGNILLAGRTDGDFDGLTSNGGFDAFVALFDSAGTKLAAQLIGTSSDDAGNVVLQGVDGSYYLAGMSGGDLNGEINQSPGTYDALITSFKISPQSASSASLSLVAVVDTLSETTDITNPVKVADIQLDGSSEQFAYSLSGADAGFFEITGQSVFLRQGTFLSYDSGKTSYTFSVQASDPSDSSVAPLSVEHTLSLSNTPPAAPTVDPLSTSLARPTIGGSIVLETGADFTVTLNNRVYRHGDGLTLFGNRWELVPDEDLPNGVYDVVAAHADSTGSLTTLDATSNELLINATAPIRQVDVTLVSPGAEDSGAVGAASSSSTRFLVSRSSADSVPLVVYYTIEGSAVPGSDFLLPSAFDAVTGIGSVLIPAGQSSSVIELPTINNAAYDDVRTLGIRLLADSSYQLKQDFYAASANLIDDDPEPAAVVPVVSLEGQSFSEGSDGIWRARSIKVSLSEASDRAVSVDLDVRSLASELGGATREVDFRIPDQRITFAPGVTEILVELSIYGDAIQEGDSEFFDLALANPSDGLVLSGLNALARYAIADDDLGKVIDFSSDPVGNSAIKGSDFGDQITGTNFADVISAGDGSDSVRGMSGSDRIVLGPGADTIIYGGHAESSVSDALDHMDLIYDFNRLEGDRFRLPSAPVRLWSGGSSNQSNPLLAAQALFVDRSTLQSGLQPLAAGEALVFTTGSGRRQRFFLAVNDQVAGYQPFQDLLVDITGTAVRSDLVYRQVGTELIVADFFSSL